MALRAIIINCNNDDDDFYLLTFIVMEVQSLKLNVGSDDGDEYDDG